MTPDEQCRVTGKRRGPSFDVHRGFRAGRLLVLPRDRAGGRPDRRRVPPSRGQRARVDVPT